MINTVLQWHGWHLCCFVAKFVQHNLRCFVFCRDTYFVAVYTLSMWRQIRPKILSVEKNDKYDICILVIQTLVELEREEKSNSLLLDFHVWVLSTFNFLMLKWLLVREIYMEQASNCLIVKISSYKPATQATLTIATYNICFFVGMWWNIQLFALPNIWNLMFKIWIQNILKRHVDHCYVFWSFLEAHGTLFKVKYLLEKGASICRFQTNFIMLRSVFTFKNLAPILTLCSCSHSDAHTPTQDLLLHTVPRLSSTNPLPEASGLEKGLDLPTVMKSGLTS